jgi:hypothetical protein
VEFSRLFNGTPEDWVETVERYEDLFAAVQAREGAISMDLSEIMENKEPREWTADERAEVADFMLASQGLVREIRSMAARGAPVYPLDLAKGMLVELPHLAKLRSCARLLRHDAIVKAMQGNKAEAVEDIIAGMKLGDALAPEPVLVSQLVRIAVYRIMYQVLQDCFDGADLSPELTRRLMMQIAQADNHGAFADALAGQGYTGLRAFSDIGRGSLTYRAVLAMGGGNAGTWEFIGQRLFARLCSSPLGKPLRNLDEASYADIMSLIARAAELPYYKAAQQRYAVQEKFAILPRARAVTRMQTPYLAHTYHNQARHEAMLDLAQLGLLIEQYKAKNGSLPATIDDIASELGGSVPVDPFTGGPYRYRPSGDTFLLYSVGRNLSDDGGKHDYDFTGGDIVWRGKKER